MNSLEFAKAMIEYEELYRKLQDLEEKISQYVMTQEESQKIGNVTARYTHGRTIYDYTQVTGAYPLVQLDPIIQKHTTTVDKIDWRSVCEEMEWTPPIKQEPTPSVKVQVKT